MAEIQFERPKFEVRDAGWLALIASVAFFSWEQYQKANEPHRSLRATVVSAPFRVPARYASDPKVADPEAFYQVSVINTGNATATRVKLVFPGATDWCVQPPHQPLRCSVGGDVMAVPDLDKGDELMAQVWTARAALNRPRITHFEGEAKMELATPTFPKNPLPGWTVALIAGLVLGAGLISWQVYRALKAFGFEFGHVDSPTLELPERTEKA